MGHRSAISLAGEANFASWDHGTLASAAEIGLLIAGTAITHCRLRAGSACRPPALLQKAVPDRDPGLPPFVPSIHILSSPIGLRPNFAAVELRPASMDIINLN